MTTTIPVSIALGALMALLPAAARSGNSAPPGRMNTDASTSAPVLLAQANGPEAQDSQAAPPEASPESAPPESSPPPVAAPRAERSAPPGQWVYTQQYGWIWMPYADAYTYLPSDQDGEPYMYVYAPAFGWSWVVAPWVWGWGPWPYFGVHGSWHFGWYGRGWWGHPGYWWGRPWRGHYRAAPYRGGVPFRHVVPAPRAVRPSAPGVGRPVPRPRMGVGAPRRR